SCYFVCVVCLHTCTLRSFGNRFLLERSTKDTHPFEETYLSNVRFKAAVVKECIHDILREQLSGVQYDPDEVGVLSRSLADCIKDKLKDVGFDRYKLVVQVVIGEQRGEGVKMAARCFWDADTDSYAQDIFMNDSLFCVAAAFGSYFY
uniref:Dynein light chain Tctex-type 2B n=1 Tax=Oncorhynchus tshawytscha TaxID=74940 RepID=A0AAZ3SQZ7_ONCTS